MFYLVAKVGSQLAVYDDTDHVVEWFNREQLLNYLDMGVTIQGFTKESAVPITNCTCNYTDCNWTPSGTNIFKVADKSRVKISSSVVTLVAEGKKFKFKVLSADKSTGTAMVKFTNGMNVKLPLGLLLSFKKE